MNATTAVRYFFQACGYALFIALVGYFAASPTYRHADPDTAMLKFAFGHAAKRVGECTRLTQEELAALAPNMRRPDRCPRQRHPVYLEIEIDGNAPLATLHTATGIWSDGPASIYESFTVPAGPHSVVVRMRDLGREEGFDFETEADINLASLEHRLVRFDARTGFDFDSGESR